jgi:hypothetical protein
VAVAQGLAPHHAIKHVDRVLSPPKLAMEQGGGWVPCVVGERHAIFVTVDWTECVDADQCTVVLGMQPAHGRRTPLVWQTVTRSELKHQRNDHADAVLVVFAAVVPQNVRVPVVAARGVSDSQLARFLTEELGWDDIIRFRGVV